MPILVDPVAVNKMVVLPQYDGTEGVLREKAFHEQEEAN